MELLQIINIVASLGGVVVVVGLAFCVRMEMYRTLQKLQELETPSRREQPQPLLGVVMPKEQHNA